METNPSLTPIPCKLCNKSKLPHELSFKNGRLSHCKDCVKINETAKRRKARGLPETGGWKKQVFEWIK